MRSAFWASFGVSALFVTVACIATDARAKTTRSFSASACVPLITPARVTGELTSYGQLVNYDPANVLVAACPVVSDSQLWGTAGAQASLWSATIAHEAHVHVWSAAAGGVTVDVCRTYFTGFGGTCVPAASAAGAGVYDLSFDPSSAWAAGDQRDGYWFKAQVSTNSAIFSYSFGNP